jgi:WhiB family redox-sensing transcriptional regulator
MLIAHAWMEYAACADLPTDLFFPEPGKHAPKQALEACRRCPVRDDCLEYALGFELLPGIFAGLSQRQRAQLQDKRRRL